MAGAALVAVAGSFPVGCAGAASSPARGAGGEAPGSLDASAPSRAEADAAAFDAGVPEAGTSPDAAPLASHDPSTFTPDELLADQIDPESQRGACAEAYRTLQQSFDRLLAEQRTRVAHLVVPRAPRTFAASVVDVAARAVITDLPRHVCRTSARGTWALFYDDIRGVLAEEMSAARIPQRPPPMDDEEAARPDTYPLYRVKATGRLVFVPADGSPRLEAPFTLRHAPLLAIQTTEDGFLAAANTVSDLEIGDIDGDGLPELLVTGRSGDLPLLEGSDTRAHVSALYRVTSDRALALDARAPAKVWFDHLVDGDGDGLFDLASPLPFFGTDEGNEGDFEMQGPELLFHSLRGGGFSRTDAAAASFAKKSCPAPPTGLPPLPPVAPGDERPLRIYFTDGGDRAIHDVACARLWGVPSTTLRSWVTAVNGGPQLTRWSALPPPLLLTP